MNETTGAGVAGQTAKQAANVRLVQAFLEAGAAGEMEKFLATIDETVVLYVPEFLPWGGVYRGREELQKGFAAFSAGWETESFEREFVASDEQVVILQKLKARIKKGEQILETPLAELFKIRNGKIVEIRPFYFDGGKLAEAFR